MNSSNALVVLEQQLAPLAPRLNEALAKTMPVSRLIRTIVTAAERLPRLLECDRQSLFNSAMSAAVLGLEVDGVTGQAYLIPFKGKAQLVIGYKGYNTLAARSDITITGAVVREGDVFDFDLGDSTITHKPLPNNRSRIIAAWAKGSHRRRPAVITVMWIEELMEVKKRSPGAQRSDSPWNDPTIGFPAMCEKTAKRRLARSLPLNTMQLAARMDEAVDEQGKSAWITPERGTVVEGEFKTVGEIEPVPTPTMNDLIGRRETLEKGAENVASPDEGPASVEAVPKQETSGRADAGPDMSELAAYDVALAEAAKQGTDVLRKARDALPRDVRASKIIKEAFRDRHIPVAMRVDAERDGSLPTAQAADAGRVS